MPLSVLAQTGDVQGTVYQQSTGKSLAAADVHIRETDQHQKTDENGVFRFMELPEGTYTFVVTHPLEPQPTEISVDISSGDTTEVKIYLGAVFKLETVVVEGKRLPPRNSECIQPQKCYPVLQSCRGRCGGSTAISHHSIHRLNS